MEKKVEAALAQIRPILQRDGGDIELAGITEDNVVQVRPKGHSAGCPGATMTLSNIVQQLLMSSIPEVKGVVAID